MSKMHVQTECFFELEKTACTKCMIRKNVYLVGLENTTAAATD